MVRIKAKCYCPTHGRLEFDNIQIRNGSPICMKCSNELVFGVVRPRKLNDNGHEAKKK